MNMITCPGEGTWLNSCLVGANSYRVATNAETYAHSFLEERTDDWPRMGTDRHYAEVTSSWDSHKMWMILFPMTRQGVLPQAGVIEKVQTEGLYQNGFFWPFDLVLVGDRAGYLIRPIDTVRYRPVRTYLGKTKVERWTIAISAFRRIQALHQMGLVLGGFSREQLRVDVETNELYFWPGETAAHLGERTDYVCRDDYLAVPQKIEQINREAGIQLTGQVRDIFSCAVLAFYLLYFTHPFVGSAYWPLMREDYWVQYWNRPAYIFDPVGENNLGYLDFEQEIRCLWDKSDPALRKLFDDLFLSLTHPGSVSEDDLRQATDPARWILLLQRDAETNGAPDQRTEFPFEMMNNYQV